MSRRRVLFIAYYFPPLGGGGVQRSAKFVRYLPDHGFDPIVLTGPGPTDERWAPTDVSGGDDVPTGVRVIRVAGPVPNGERVWRSRLRKLTCAPTAFDRWWSREVADVARGVRDVDVIYASMSPFSSAGPAAMLARHFGVPWIADLRDPWALEEYFEYPTALHLSLERRRMRRSLASAAALVLPTPGTLERVQEAFPEFRGRAVEIRNGFDPDEFDGGDERRSDDLFHLVHAGNFYFHHEPRRGIRRLLGGMNGDVDLLPRSPAFLLKALDRLCDEQPEVGLRMRLHLAGVLTPVERAMVERARCRCQVEVHGFLPHAETVRLISSADALFLPMHALSSGVRSTIFPGKAYEYLASGRPILAAVPAGDAREVIERAEWTVVCDPDDVGAMADGLVTLADQRDQRRQENANRTELLRPFERPRLASQLAGVLDHALSTNGRRPA